MTASKINSVYPQSLDMLPLSIQGQTRAKKPTCSRSCPSATQQLFQWAPEYDSHRTDLTDYWDFLQAQGLSGAVKTRERGDGREPKKKKRVLESMFHID